MRKNKTPYKFASKREKVSSYIVEQIRDSILSGLFKAGDRVASEKDLLAEFDVSKATLREALRVLEAMGLIELRKGVSGGIFIAEVDMKTTLNSITNFLHFRSVSQYDITMIRVIIEPVVAQIAATKATPEDIDNLKKIAENPRESIKFHRYLGRMTGNPLLILIMDFVHNILRDITVPLNLGDDFYDTIKIHHLKIIEALAEKAPKKAASAIVLDLLSIDKYKSRITNTPSFDPTSINFDIKDASLLVEGIESRLSPHTIEELKKSGLLFQKLSTGELYLFVSQSND